MAPADFDALQRHWYGKLRAEGFRDVESGRDLNDGYWTFGWERHVQLGRDEGEEPLAEHPTAEFWRAVGLAANDLPMNYPKRAFILAAAESGNVEGSGKKHGIAHPTQAWRAWWRFLERAGLDVP